MRWDMPDASTPSEPQLGARIRAFRKKRELSLDALAALSGVSRATISKIELDQVTPSTKNLSKIAEALGSSFAELMSPEAAGELVILRSGDQPVMTDATSGFKRTCIAPILPSRGIDWVLNELPPGVSTGEFVPHRVGVEEYIYVLSGKLEACLGADVHLLSDGDALFFQAHKKHAFKAVGKRACRFMLIIHNRT